MARTSTCRLCGKSFEPHGRGMRYYCKPCTAKADRAASKETATKCKECGKRFSISSRFHVYCSDGCRIEGGRRRIREYMRRYLADPEKRAMYLARARAGAASRTAGAGRRPAGSGGRRNGGRAAARPPSRPLNMERSTCRLCGRSFVPYGSAARAHCKQCAARFDREVSRALRAKCKECGKEFSAKSRNFRYCSDKCRADGHRRGAREYVRRRTADPEQRAIMSARGRAQNVAYRARKKAERAK